MKILSKLVLFLIIFSFISNCVMVSAQETDFSWNEFDSGYVTFVVDDGRATLQSIHDLFKHYDMPLSAAIIASHLDETSENYNPSLKNVLVDIENHGGEILSHTYNHKSFSVESTLNDVKYQFSNSYHILTNAGFNINGIIEAGSGGNEKTVDYNMVETVSRKYYKYSDHYGVSTQYKSSRIGANDNNLKQIKAQLIRAGRNKEWVILMCHDFNELSVDGFNELLSFIAEKDNIKMVTYRDMYEKFGNYSTKQDFGVKKYTVKYLHNGKTVYDEVLSYGTEITPPKAENGFKWDENLTVCDYNYTVNSVKINDKAKNGTNNKEVNTKPIIIGAATAAAVGIIGIILKKRKKNDEGK